MFRSILWPIRLYLELIDRERRAADRRLKAAKFPTIKTLETLDFKAQPTVNKFLAPERDVSTDGRRAARR